MSHRVGLLLAWSLLSLTHISVRSSEVIDISRCGEDPNTKSSSLLAIFLLYSHEGADLPKQKIWLKGLQLLSTPALLTDECNAHTGRPIIQ